MELDHSGLFAPRADGAAPATGQLENAPDAELAPPLGPDPATKSPSWLQRRKIIEEARKLYAANDLPGFLTLARHHKEISSKTFPTARHGRLNLLLPACAFDRRPDWIRALLAMGASQEQQDLTTLIYAATTAGDAPTIQALLDSVPNFLLMPLNTESQRTYPLELAVAKLNHATVDVLLPHVISLCHSGSSDLIRQVAQTSWQDAHRAAQRQAKDKPTIGTLAIFALFNPKPAPAPGPAPAPAATAPVAREDSGDEMPAFAKILLAKIDGLQSHIQRQDQTIMALGEKVQALLDGSAAVVPRPAATPPLGPLGHFGQRFRKTASQPQALADKPPKPR